jgi:hypothetical protein
MYGGSPLRASGASAGALFKSTGAPRPLPLLLPLPCPPPRRLLLYQQRGSVAGKAAVRARLWRGWQQSRGGRAVFAAPSRPPRRDAALPRPHAPRLPQAQARSLSMWRSASPLSTATSSRRSRCGGGQRGGQGCWAPLCKQPTHHAGRCMRCRGPDQAVRDRSSRGRSAAAARRSSRALGAHTARAPRRRAPPTPQPHPPPARSNGGWRRRPGTRPWPTPW